MLRSSEPVGFTLQPPASSEFQVGGEGTGSSLAGTLDELRLSNTVRSAAEIYDSYVRGLSVTALTIAPDPVTVVEGWTVLPDITATCAGGITLTVASSLCAWTVADPGIAAVNAAGEIVGLAVGNTTATATWRGATGNVVVHVSDSLPAPGDPRAQGFRTTALVAWDPVADADVVGYEIERRPVGGQFQTVKRVLARTDFTDGGLAPGGTYEYRIVGIDAGGTRLTLMSETCAASLQADLVGLSLHKNLEILFAIYTDGYEPADVERMIAGARKGLEFYWRTTGCVLNFDPTFLIIDGPAPAGEWGPEVEADLRARGVLDHQYDLAYLMANNLVGCMGGYQVFGSTFASLGTVCGVPYPGNDPDIDYTMTWSFTHEIHHALEGMDSVTGPVTPPVLFCHFPWCYPDPLGGGGGHVDWAAHYDGIGESNRLYGGAWFSYPAPYDQILECVDADGDGLPDDDARVPVDETRFLSLPSLADSDEDGLDDLAEFSRYDFRGTDPLDDDTDDDGRLDGFDHEPLYAVGTELPRLASGPVIDGVIEAAWPLLTSGYYFSHAAPFDLLTYAGYTPDGLYLAFAANARLRFKLSLDGSGQDGRFESPVRHVEGATDTDNLDNKHNHIGDTWGDGHHIVFNCDSDEAAVFNRDLIPGAIVATTEAWGVFFTEVMIPAALPGGAAYTWYPPGSGTPTTEGLTLAAGHFLGLSLVVSDLESSGDDEFDGAWTSLFEPHAYVDFALGDYAAAVEGPDSGGVQRTRFEGVSPNPFNPVTTVRFALAAAGEVELAVFDLAGRRVATLVDGSLPSGRHEAVFDGTRCASGIYLCRLKTAGFEATERLVLVK